MTACLSGFQFSCFSLGCGRKGKLLCAPEEELHPPSSAGQPYCMCNTENMTMWPHLDLKWATCVLGLDTGEWVSYDFSIMGAQMGCVGRKQYMGPNTGKVLCTWPNLIWIFKKIHALSTWESWTEPRCTILNVLFPDLPFSQCFANSSHSTCCRATETLHHLI